MPERNYDINNYLIGYEIYGEGKVVSLNDWASATRQISLIIQVMQAVRRDARRNEKQIPRADHCVTGKMIKYLVSRNFEKLFI